MQYYLEMMQLNRFFGLKEILIRKSALVLALACPIGLVEGAITAVNAGNFGGTTAAADIGIFDESITVGAGADMLVLMTSSELGAFGTTGSDGVGTGIPMSVTYGGVTMNLASGNQSIQGIWYLDLSTPGISGTNIQIDITGYGTRNGFAVGWVTLDGNLGAGESIALHSVANSASTDTSLDLVTTVESFNVVAFNGNNTGTINSIDGALTEIYSDTDIGSARTAAGYEQGVAAGTSNYAWSINTASASDYRRIDAASFTVVPEPSSLLLAGLGGILLLRRRR